jgi:lysophospholipase L1-like esterase
VAICLGTAAQQKPEIGKHGDYFDRRATLFETLKVDSTNIVFLGNSLTDGCEWHELLGMPNVINRGISGDIVEGIYDRLQPVLDGHPAKIFLMIGVNDISHDLTADSIASSIIDLAARIRRESPSTRLYVQSLLPFNNSFERYKRLYGKEQVARDINSQLRPAIEALGATWVELYDSFADQDGNLRSDLTNDGLHLLGAGYLLWRDIVLPYVKE